MIYRDNSEKEKEEASMNEITKSIIDKVNCPNTVFSEESSGEVVRKAYADALVRGREEGFTPILVVSDDTLEEWLCILEEENYSKEEIISKVTGCGREILAKRYQEYQEDFEETEDISLENEEWLGTMKGGECLMGLTAFQNYDGNRIRETILFEIPVTNPWEVIAWMPTGGWNEYPPASEMIEICRYWYEEYHAIPAVFSHDELEFYVGKELADEEKAWKLAREHYAFCPDRVDQCTGSGTLGEVADCLNRSRVWYFWWD